MFVAIGILLFAHYCFGEPCVSRDYGQGSIVCVCNATYCDTLPQLEDFAASGAYQLFTSNEAGLRFSQSDGSFSSATSSTWSTDLIYVTVDTSTTYQTLKGFGSTFTDAAVLNAGALSEAARENLLSAYFGPNGSQYTLGRVPIAGTDFSTYGYTYADDGEGTLDQFALKDEDYNYKIPYILQAYNLSNGALDLLASAWSSPAWSKASGTLRGGLLLTEYYQLWADYYVKFFEAYENEGIQFWALTTQNEPASGLIPESINAIGWTPSLLITWIKENLGPTLKNSSYSDLKIIIHDDQRATIALVQEYYADDDALSYIDGVAVHWYADSTTPANFLESVQTSKKDVFLISTEASTGYLSVAYLDQAVRLGYWPRAIDYARYIIQDLNYDSVGWIDWNFAVDLDGGPSWLNNGVDAGIVVNATANEFYKQPLYYALAQFSKFIPPGSVRVDVSPSTLASAAGIETVGFQRPDGAIALVLQNTGVETTVTINDANRGSAALTLTQNSINTFVYA